MTANVTLRKVTDQDLPIFFQQEQDPDARHMAAFTSADPTNYDAFMAHWARIRADDSTVNRAIEYDGQLVGSIGSWHETGISGDRTRELGYWLGKPFWGKGIATQALTLFVRELPERPLFAHAAKDNAASIRVLEKCGFHVIGEGAFFSHARGAEVSEVLMRLDA